MFEYLGRRRILVLGASGWLGRSLVRELQTQGSQDHMLVASRARQEVIGSQNCHVEIFSMPKIRDFSPEVVINCAFLTKDKFKLHDVQEFIKINERLTSNFFETLSLPHVGLGVTISSGSATLPSADSIELNPYGYLKKLEQEQLLSLRSSTLTVGVARAWSLSGDLVTNPKTYALSDFVWQALTTGQITVNATSEVWRRYCDATEFLKLSLGAIITGRESIVDSGGPLVELRELAHIVSEVVGGVEVSSTSPVGISDIYASNGQQYEQLCKEFGISIAPLSSQVHRVTRAFRGRLSDAT